jgi:hypothetical protein
MTSIEQKQFFPGSYLSGLIPLRSEFSNRKIKERILTPLLLGHTKLLHIV